jgi:hypothetical protein
MHDLYDCSCMAEVDEDRQAIPGGYGQVIDLTGRRYPAMTQPMMSVVVLHAFIIYKGGLLAMGIRWSGLRTAAVE